MRKSIYGLALIDGYQRTTGEKLDVIGRSYYARKTNGVYNDGYASRSIPNNSTGYKLGCYYGDGLLFYAEVIQGSSILVKLYYWDGELIGCRDYRGDGNLYSTGSEVLNSIAKEFSSVYEIGMSNY